jgi:NADPH:quinone reductase-like Zn-dependent oxidoreductase
LGVRFLFSKEYYVLIGEKYHESENDWIQKDESDPDSRNRGPEIMYLEEVDLPTPRAGEVLTQIAAAGVNYADLAQRQRTYLTRTSVPTTLGFEVAGTVVEQGAGASSPAVGAQVAAFAEGASYEHSPTRRRPLSVLLAEQRLLGKQFRPSQGRLGTFACEYRTA